MSCAVCRSLREMIRGPDHLALIYPESEGEITLQCILINPDDCLAEELGRTLEPDIPNRLERLLPQIRPTRWYPRRQSTSASARCANKELRFGHWRGS